MEKILILDNNSDDKGNYCVVCVGILKTVNREKNEYNLSFGHLKSAQTETMDFIFVITATPMIISSRLKVTQS